MSQVFKISLIGLMILVGLWVGPFAWWFANYAIRAVGGY